MDPNKVSFHNYLHTLQISAIVYPTLPLLHKSKSIWFHMKAFMIPGCTLKKHPQKCTLKNLQAPESKRMALVIIKHESGLEHH